MSEKTDSNEASTSLRVMVIDDEDRLLTAISRLLQRMGHATLSFSDPKDALRYFESDPSRIDIVITDHRMPSMLGIELAARVNAIRPELPVVICSGFAMDLDPSAVATAGVVGVLDKPFTTVELNQAIVEATQETEMFEADPFD